MNSSNLSRLIMIVDVFFQSIYGSSEWCFDSHNVELITWNANRHRWYLYTGVHQLWEEEEEKNLFGSMLQKSEAGW